jgi:hypothetical protein
VRSSVDRQHDGLVRRVQIQPDDIPQLGLEFRVGRALERGQPPRLQTPLLPQPGDGGVIDVELISQRP